MVQLQHGTRWKGGRYVNSYGYALVYMPEHPRIQGRGYVLEHVLVAEKKLGRPIQNGERVHHINGIKTDNNPENLMVFSSESEHQKEHQRLAHIGRIVVPCLWCNKPRFAKGLCRKHYQIEYRKNEKKLCSVCGKPQIAIGLCGKHYGHYHKTDETEKYKREYMHEWRKNHKEHIRNYDREYRKRKKLNGGS